jgi:hypothetical protein
MILFFFFAGRVIIPLTIDIISTARDLAWTVMGVSP